MSLSLFLAQAHALMDAYTHTRIYIYLFAVFIHTQTFHTFTFTHKNLTSYTLLLPVSIDTIYIFRVDPFPCAGKLASAAITTPLSLRRHLRWIGFVVKLSGKIH